MPRVHICHRGSVHFPHERDTIPESKLCHQVAQVLFIVGRPAATDNRQRGSCLGRPACHIPKRLDRSLNTLFPGYSPRVQQAQRAVVGRRCAKPGISHSPVDHLCPLQAEPHPDVRIAEIFTGEMRVGEVRTARRREPPEMRRRGRCLLHKRALPLQRWSRIEEPVPRVGVPPRHVHI